MWISIAPILVTLVLTYLGLGLVFSLVFVLRGVSRVDPAAEGAPWAFRLLLVPGSAALWPLLLRRWITGMPPPEEATAHRRHARPASEETP